MIGEHFLWDTEAAKSCEAYEMANRRARLTDHRQDD